MNVKWLLALLAVATLPAMGQQQIYECPGEGGVRTFTDTPCPAGKPLQLPSPNVIDTGPPPQPRAAAPQPAAPAYTGFAILSPEQGGTLHTNTGQFPVALALEPALQPGNVIQVTLDGTPLQAQRDTLQFDISSDEWNTAAVAEQPHTLAVSVVDASGKTVIAAAPVQFYVQRAFIRKQVAPR